MGDRSLRIDVDLVPLLPEGLNGGASVLALELVRRMSARAPHHHFRLLAQAAVAPLLDGLRGATVEVATVPPPGAAPAPPVLRRHAGRLPPSLLAALRTAVAPLRAAFAPRPAPPPGPVADVVFCPFGPPLYASEGVPAVSAVHDVQHRAYPQFFDPAEAATRERNLQLVTRRAAAVVFGTAHARDAMIDAFGLDRTRAHVIPMLIHDRLPRPAPDDAARERRGLGLDETPYLLYPANFWPHKNHLILLAALALVAHRRAGLPLQLVLTGAPATGAGRLRETAERLGLAARVHFTGHVSDEALAALYAGCRAVVFPSLYEGFGMPVLEAFSFGRPVACARATALPEVAGDAADTFDPRKLHDLADTLERLATDDAHAAELSRRGAERLRLLEGQDTAAAYLDLVERTAGR